jgi:cyclopropane fatty-acyl-phospholipid synthase-like methyltransferase
MIRSEQILKHVDGRHILDVGCAGHNPKPGSPYWLHGRLLEKFPSVAGIDLNSENIEKLLEMGFENIEIANAEEFDLHTTFDCIVAGELIEHLSNPGHFLERCRAHLKGGGRLVISTPHAFSLLYFSYAVLKYPKTCQNDEHTLWFCPKTLAGLASRYGFRVVSWELIEDYEFDNSSKLYLFFARFMTTLGRLLIPGRLRKNTMIFVFELDR